MGTEHVHTIFLCHPNCHIKKNQKRRWMICTILSLPHTGNSRNFIPSEKVQLWLLSHGELHFNDPDVVKNFLSNLDLHFPCFCCNKQRFPGICHRLGLFFPLWLKTSQMQLIVAKPLHVSVTSVCHVVFANAMCPKCWCWFLCCLVDFSFHVPHDALSSIWWECWCLNMNNQKHMKTGSHGAHISCQGFLADPKSDSFNCAWRARQSGSTLTLGIDFSRRRNAHCLRSKHHLMNIFDTFLLSERQNWNTEQKNKGKQNSRTISCSRACTSNRRALRTLLIFALTGSMWHWTQKARSDCADEAETQLPLTKRSGFETRGCQRQISVLNSTNFNCCMAQHPLWSHCKSLHWHHKWDLLSCWSTWSSSVSDMTTVEATAWSLTRSKSMESCLQRWNLQHSAKKCHRFESSFCMLLNLFVWLLRHELMASQNIGNQLKKKLSSCVLQVHGKKLQAAAVSCCCKQQKMTSWGATNNISINRSPFVVWKTWSGGRGWSWQQQKQKHSGLQHTFCSHVQWSKHQHTCCTIHHFRCCCTTNCSKTHHANECAWAFFAAPRHSGISNICNFTFGSNEIGLSIFCMSSMTSIIFCFFHALESQFHKLVIALSNQVIDWSLPTKWHKPEWHPKLLHLDLQSNPFLLTKDCLKSQQSVKQSRTHHWTKSACKTLQNFSFLQAKWHC